MVASSHDSARRVAWTLLVLGPLTLALAAWPAGRAASPRNRGIRFDESMFASGDVLFRRGRSVLSRAVLMADGRGEYSHVGLVSVVGRVPWVIHSTPPEEPMTKGGAVAEPLAVFLAPGETSAAALYRPLDRRAATAAERAGWSYVHAHLPFDAAFDLRTPRELYCTELVWRAYRTAGVDLAPGAAGGLYRYLLPSRLMLSPAIRLVRSFTE